MKHRILGKHNQQANDFAYHEKNRRVKCAFTIGNGKRRQAELTPRERRMQNLLYKDVFDKKVSEQSQQYRKVQLKKPKQE